MSDRLPNKKPAAAGFLLPLGLRPEYFQHGFTLIEMAIVMVIIGMLLSGALKGAELISNSRARNVIAQQDAIRAAFLGFQDRFRALPGDYPGVDASRNIKDVAPGIGGNGDGKILNTSSNEQTIAWTHLSKAGFLAAEYSMSSATESVTIKNTPKNIFNAFLQIAHDENFAQTASTARNNIKTGNRIPVDILAEIDRKIDDGNAMQGAFRYSAFNGATTAPDESLCYSTDNGNWRVDSNSDNCGGANLF
ncbi:MAG: type II secretion system GspH family protein [Sulfuricella denitrificans]|nr:type II secretion system GspH family protein [Sulfuricella denitrificans]